MTVAQKSLSHLSRLMCTSKRPYQIFTRHHSTPAKAPSTSAKLFTQTTQQLTDFFGNAKRLKLITDVNELVNLRHVQLQRPLNILDIGAGTGMHAGVFATQGHLVTALDPDADLLAEGKKRYAHSNLEFRLDSLPRLESVGNKTFDIIYSIACWQYLKPQDRQQAITRTLELLASNGRFVLVWPLPMSRENQFTLEPADLIKNVQAANARNPASKKVKCFTMQSIPDPDGRMGFLEPKVPVHFQVLVGQRENIKAHS